MCRDIWLLYMCLCVAAVIKGCRGNNVILSSQSLDQWENTDVTLTCAYSGSYTYGAFRWYLNLSSGELLDTYVKNDCKPLKLWLSNNTVYSYICINNTVHTVTLKNITQQRHGETWKCGFNVGEQTYQSNTLQILVKVPVKNTTITPNTNDVFTTKENTQWSFVCKTSECRPEPKFQWYKQTSAQSDGGETIITETVPKNSLDVTLQSYNHTYILTFNRTWNGWTMFCGASNRNGSIVLSRKILINITYPPDGPPRIGLYQNGSTIKIIKNTSLDLICSITGGNPLPKLEWKNTGSFKQTLFGNTVTNTITWQASDNNRHDLMCLSSHQHQNDTTHVSVEVLYPPESIDVSLKVDTDSTYKITHNFSVIENASNTMLLICSARSNPSPNRYWWTGPIQSSSARLELNMTRYVRGTYTCHVNNTMTAYDGSTEQGYNSAPYIVEILQPPDIGILDDAKVVEGNDVTIACPIISGNDTWRSVTWLNKHRSQVGKNGILFINNVTRLSNGTYTCHLNYTLQPSHGLHKLETKTKGFFLDVVYQAEVLSLSVNTDVNSLIVNETSPVHFVCIVESNPNSTVEITFNDKILSTINNTQTLDYLIHSANCSDTGTYVCTGSNVYNKGHKAMLNNTLFVICSPRRSPFFEHKQNVTSALNDTATFQFTAMAYPPPRFQWYRMINESETSETHGGVITNYRISTTEMQTNFTFDKVEDIHYGEYLLKVENQYGTLTQTFFLVAEGKPNPPTFYGFYPESVSSNSVTIWWEPGFDGGLPQSFIISYNLTLSKWYNESAISHNKERRMNKTITELASSSVYHVLIYAQNEKGAVRAQHAIIVNTKEITIGELKNPSNIGAAAGGAFGGLLAIVVVVIAAVFIVRKRSSGKQEPAQGEKCDLKHSHTYTNVSKEIHTQKLKEGDTAFLLETKQASLDSPKLPERMPTKVAATHHLQELDDYDDKADERIYGNTYEMIKRIERINVSELLPYLTNKPTDFFGSEFTKLPAGLLKPYEFSQKPENIALNRYHGIYPYDHSRVKIADEPSFFINACYIDGYKKKKAFIASLGPLSKTTYNFVTFWKMVWSEKSDVIVMLTKLTEPSGVKCDPYWPKPESTQVYGDVTVTNVGEDAYSDYVLRNFTLSKGNERRKLMQFHFMAWPDKSIPEDVTCLLEFRKRVNANHSSGPIIVHCSAGIGRTGTLIALEILIEEGRRKGSVNVVECVKTMRGQRTSMVQTVDQYHYIYKALANALVFDCEAITPQKFQKYVDKTNTDQFNKMFQTLNQTVEADSTLESNTRTANKMQRDKNRMGSDIPGDSHRVRLFLNRDEETSLDYINAVYIDSFTKKDYFIVAQSPMTNGVEDFLCMIYQVECSCIVSLGDTQQGRNVGMYTPADNTKSLSIGSFNVTCKVLDTKDNYVIRKIKIEFKGKYEGGEKEVYHFEYTDWALGQKTPSDPHSFVQFTREVETFASQLGTGKSQVLVHCLNAYERSCLFCAVVTLVEKVKYEGEVCVSNTLRHIRARRRLAIPNMEQFQFCFRAVCAYINMDTPGSSIEEKSYINIVLA